MWSEGIIITDSGDVIARPKMTCDELRLTRPGLDGTFWRDATNSLHENILAMPFRLRGHKCEGGAYFVNHRLAIFIFLLVREEAAGLFGMNQRTDKSAEGTFYQEWVEAEVGKSPPIRLPWGMIGADYDSKTLDSSVFFKYQGDG